MSGSAGERARRAFGWISILWFTSALSLAGSDMVNLETAQEVLAGCGDNVTLTCNVTFLQRSISPNISLFAWVNGKTHLCQHSNDQPDPKVQCESTVESSQHRLTLTLLNVMPVNEPKYLCKLQSSLGTKASSAVLTLRNCLESNISSINGSHVHCRFTGVYPKGTVHWLHGDENLTRGAVTQEEQDQQGRFTITSSVAIEERNQSQPFNCSLMIPAEGRYLSSLVVWSKSAGGVDKLHWICFLVEMMVFKSVA